MNLQVTAKNILAEFYPDTDTISVTHDGYTWKQDPAFRPTVTLLLNGKEVTLPFSDALCIHREEIHTGVGDGWKIVYSHWQYEGSLLPLSLTASYWLEKATGRLYAELNPLVESDETVDFCWPAPFLWENHSDTAYTVIPMMQGTLIPNNWPHAVEAVAPPFVYDRAAYMPWLGQIDCGHGCLQIITTPFDCGYDLNHPAGGPTRLNMHWCSSMGKISYKRTLRMEFFSDCDYNTFCKSYRRYVKEHGKLLTLKQKAVSNPNLNRLAGSPVIHTCIYSYIKPEAVIYKTATPDMIRQFATFAERQEQLRALKVRGLQKAYLHLDGWGVDGYDQRHPDVLPPCEAAGGADAMKEFQDACRELDVLFAIHDQYRDYYHDAATYDPKNSMHEAGQNIPSECTWNGGPQDYLCTSMADQYVRRNHMGLEELGICPDGVYLDVFSVVRPDECRHPEHPMTRTECIEYRANCFEYLRAKGAIMSSEEACDFAIPHLDLCHHAPYPGTWNADQSQTPRGIPVPLMNLVYHDCIMTPWQIRDDAYGRLAGKKPYLYALLNGGMPYLDIQADETEIALAQTVAAFQEKVAFAEMVRHEFVDGNRNKERTVFDNGLSITVDFESESYVIEKA